MMNSAKIGKWIVISIITLLVLIDIATIVFTSTSLASINQLDEATYYLMQGIFRFILTALLLLYLYKGRAWAKWVTVALCGLTGLYSAYLHIQSFNIVGIILALIYLASTILLVASKDVQEFMRKQNKDSYRYPGTLQ